MNTDITLIYEQECQSSQKALMVIREFKTLYPQYSINLVSTKEKHPILKTMVFCVTPSTVIKGREVMVGIPTTEKLISALTQAHGHDVT